MRGAQAFLVRGAHLLQFGGGGCLSQPNPKVTFSGTVEVEPERLLSSKRELLHPSASPPPRLSMFI